MKLSSAILIGLVGIVGAGILVLLGEAGTLAGSTGWLCFVVVGGIVLLTGHSFGERSVWKPIIRAEGR